jgi:transcriptional regulator with XRE-family HTH domain
MEDLSEKLRQFFKDEGLTQEKIADILGVTQPYVNSLLSGKRAFGKNQAQRFEELFGISASWLLTGKGEMVLKRVVQNNQNGNNVLGETVTLNEENSTEKFIALLQKKDEQIDRLLTLLELKLKE